MCARASVFVLFRIIIHVITDAIERSYWPIRKIEILMPIIMCVCVCAHLPGESSNRSVARPRPLFPVYAATHRVSHICTTDTHTRAYADGKRMRTRREHAQVFARAKFSSRQGCNLVSASAQSKRTTMWRRRTHTHTQCAYCARVQRPPVCGAAAAPSICARIYVVSVPPRARSVTKQQVAMMNARCAVGAAAAVAAASRRRRSDEGTTRVHSRALARRANKHIKFITI